MVDIVNKLKFEADKLSGGLARHIDGFDAFWLREAATEIATLRQQLEEAREKMLEEAARKVLSMTEPGELAPASYFATAIRALSHTGKE